MVERDGLFVGGDVVEEPGDRVVEVELARVEELEDRDVCEVDRGGAEGVDGVGKVGPAALAVGEAVALFEEDLAVTDEQDAAREAAADLTLDDLLDRVPTRRGGRGGGGLRDREGGGDRHQGGGEQHRSGVHRWLRG